MKDSENRWNLNDILKEEEFDSLYLDLERDIDALKAYFKEMHPDMSEEEFREYALFNERMGAKYRRLYNFPQLMADADSTSEKANLMKEKAKNLVLESTEIETKIELWLQGKEIDDKPTLDDANAKRLFSAVRSLEESFIGARESAKYSLSEAEENIIAAKDLNGINVLIDLRSEIDTEFKFKFKPRGLKNIFKKKTNHTIEELIKYFDSNNPKEREDSYRLLLTKYKENINKFFTIYQSIVKDWVYFAKKRGYNSPISCRNHDNEVPDEAIATLLQTCSENKGISQNYFRWKANELGMKKLSRFDIRAPLENKEQNIPYEKGKKLVLESLSQFSEGFAEKAKMIIDANHIDSRSRENKISGGYCCTITPDIIPYILMNYTGGLESISTLAHELGHGIHSLYAKHHYPSTQEASLPLAETASTFSEMILFEKLFSQADNDKMRRSMLSNRLIDSYWSVIRQSYFIDFEIKAHEAIPKGVTAEELSGIYFDTLTEQFGDAVDVDPVFRYEWAYVSHMAEVPFYCYAYNFGELLSMSLYSRYKKEGDKFIPEIEKILSYGGSKDPQKVLQGVGIDMCSKEFWQGSFELIKNWQKQLESYK
ncbi:MAG: M3 family oligoendopeptidase [archaeon]